ncbi:MAG TPA: NAD(P)-dependent oxidoreductase [Methylomirabilota bacterium]|nr:NAD(P)-dependent oxidoreductase [Methylomirabilota bacterium]
MKIFVTGGTGFIGSHFLEKLPAANHRGVALRRPGGAPQIPLSQEPIWVEGKLDGDWSGELSQCRALVHFAAAGVNSQQADWDELFDVNVRQSLNLWRQAVKAGVKRFVICGSCFEFGKTGERSHFIPADASLEPTNAYAASKAAATMAALALAAETKIELIILRPFDVYGEGQHESKFWPSLRKAAVAGEDFAMTAGEQIRDFIPVEKVADIFIASLVRNDLRPGEPKIENIGSGIAQNLRSFAEGQWTLMSAKGRLKIGARPYRPGEVMRYVPVVQKDRLTWI